MIDWSSTWSTAGFRGGPRGDAAMASVPLTWFPRLPAATPEQRAHWRLSGGGFGIHWPGVDEDISAEGLLRGAPASRGPSRTGA